MAEIQSLAARVQNLQISFDFWNNWYVRFVAFTVLVACIVFIFQYMAVKRGKQLAQAQDELSQAKDRQLESDLKGKDVKIAEAKLETEILRNKNSALELAVSPRVLEQNITGQSLKRFAGTEVAVISPYDFEPRRTAGQIRYMLQSVAGWKKIPGSLPQVAFFDGVVVHSGMGASGSAKEAVVSVLENNGIVARAGYPVMELGNNGVLIVVGPKPLPASLQLKPENVPADAQGNRVWGNILEE